MGKYIDKVKRIPKRIYRKIESDRYLKGKYVGKLNILSSEETLNKLKEKNRCFCRFGDGEIAIMNGESIAFQDYNEQLGKKLKQIIQSDDENLLVGINYFYLNPVNGVNQFTQGFLKSLQMQRRFLLNNCNKNRTYIDAAITQVYQNYQEYDFDAHFMQMQELLKNQSITMICGERILQDIEYNALDICKDVEFIYGPSKNAFDQYDELLQRALMTDQDRIICIVLGPTAKVLVYDLYKNGRIAWDLGHYLKDYDVYMKKRPRTDAEIAQFFKPD